MRWSSLVVLSLALPACGPEEEGFGPATCDGGGEPVLEIGDGGRFEFAPYADGAGVPLSAQQTIPVELWTSGIDTTSSTTVSVRISKGGGPTRDSLATYTLLCDEEVGYGWLGSTPYVPEDASAGDTVRVVATVTDAAGTSITAEIDLELE